MTDSARPANPLLSPGNLLTLSRLALLPLVVIALATGRHSWAAGLILVAWLTDLADGRVARRWGQASEAGRNLDTVVDFTFLYGLFIAFYVAGRLPTYQFAVLYLTKLATLILQSAWLASLDPQAIPATPLRKLAGVFAYAYLLILMMREVTPAQVNLGLFQMVIFALLTLTMVLNAAECVAGVCRRR
jgi:cardiolipin synthase